jgi:hypothetical protein
MASVGAFHPWTPRDRKNLYSAQIYSVSTLFHTGVANEGRPSWRMIFTGCFVNSGNNELFDLMLCVGACCSSIVGIRAITTQPAFIIPPPPTHQLI